MDWLGRFFRPVRPGISPLERLGTALIQTPNFSCTEANAKIIRMYLVSSLTEILGQKSEKKKEVLHWLPFKGATRLTDLL